MTVTRDGPVLIEGPVEVLLPDGSTVLSDRFVVALCVCRRSRRYPWCDTSHRRAGHRRRGGGPDGGEVPGSESSGSESSGSESSGSESSGGGPSECQRPQQ
ncbi:CDGSH iron-sulfur domain-containing protein [Peterkaempfera griseoplana]|uniref:CDGSH iron-sulfur domain-containing protein n=1 Tax=Peterkaempfera griseoplana TaxID=66896 RepID=UPI00099ECC12|nr:CDGSH iron-sulfur domain-containing protein [Peterkaempfera griseoplana]